MNFREAKRVEIGAPVYKKGHLDEQKIMHVVKKRVIRKDPSHAHWYDEVHFLCDDGEEYLHTDLYCYK